MKIGVCQTVCLDGDRSGNFARIERAVCEAVAGGAEMVCVPEMSVLGWVNPDAHKRAYSIPGEDTDRLSNIAKTYGVWLCAGLGEKDGDDLYDSAVLISDGGDIAMKHRKINLLSELMTPPYRPGKEIGAVDTRFGCVGLLICADTHDGGILKRMADLKSDLLIVPYGYAAPEENWPGHGKELEKVVCNAARRTGAIVVGPNCVGEITHGPWRGWVYGGQSVVADRGGSVVARGADRDRDVIIVEVETS